MGFFIVFAGGGLAAAARHGVNLLLARLIGVGFPFGTLAVNVLGSFLMGVIVGYFAFQGEASQNWRLFLTTGILGGFTTFSAFSLETVLLYERGELAMAAFYVVASIGLAIAGLLAGVSLLRHFREGFELQTGVEMRQQFANEIWRTAVEELFVGEAIVRDWRFAASARTAEFSALRSSHVVA